MKKVIVLLFVAFVLASILNIKSAHADSHEELFNEWENKFQDQICDNCKDPEDPEEPEEPTDPEEPEEPTDPEEPVEPEKRKDSKCSGSIGNLVWLDANENGIKDGGEKGIDDVKVVLKWIGRDFKWNSDDDEDMSTHTNSKGRYEFDDLCEGDYKIYIKGNDVSEYNLTYDPDGNINYKTKVYLDGDKDDHTKADFGFANRNTPATGSGTNLLIVASIVSLLSLLTLKQLKKVLY